MTWSIFVTVVFLLANGDLDRRDAPLYAETYATHRACAKAVNALGVGAKIQVARIVARLRPEGGLVTSISIGCTK